MFIPLHPRPAKAQTPTLPARRTRAATLALILACVAPLGGCMSVTIPLTSAPDAPASQPSEPPDDDAD